MKVVFINCSSFGSTGNIIYDLHRKLTEKGNESYVFYGIGNSRDKNWFRIGNYFSLHSHSVLSKYTGMQGYFSVFATLKLIRRIKKIDPDIIHLHNLHGSYICLPLLFRFLKKCSAKKIVTLHDCWLFTGKCPHYSAVGCDRWKKECGNCPQLHTYPQSKYKDRTKQNLKAKKKWFDVLDGLRIVAVSHWLENTAKESFLSKYTIECIYNGIDTSVFFPRDREKARERFGLTEKFAILGVSSVWNEKKGLKRFLDLSAAADKDETVIMVGLTKEQAAAMPENVIGLEKTESREELAELYSAADVFFNASVEETFGLVTAEALACGTPAVVFDSTACAEVIRDNFSRVISPDADVKAAVEYIKNNEKPVYGTSLLDPAFIKEKMVEDYFALYEVLKNDGKEQRV